MSFKIGAGDFQMLVKYVDKNAKGADLTFSYHQNGYIEIKLNNTLQEQVVITLYEEKDTGTSFPKIAVTRRLGDEIK
jgi:hypothetical protein